jgi:hypothetical protein
VRAIEALGTIEPTGPIERGLARLLLLAWFTLLVFVGQQVGQTLQGRPGAAILSLAVEWPVVRWWVGSITQREVR